MRPCKHTRCNTAALTKRGAAEAEIDWCHDCGAYREREGERGMRWGAWLLPRRTLAPLHAGPVTGAELLVLAMSQDGKVVPVWVPADLAAEWARRAREAMVGVLTAKPRGRARASTRPRPRSAP